MISIEATQTFFSGLGIAFCILSFIAVFIPSKTKFGIISLCLGNVPLWSAIVMPKSLAPVMDLFHVNQSANLFVAGCIAGAACLVIWYFVTSKIMVFIRQKFGSDSKDKTEHSESSEVSGNGEDASENKLSDTKSESANPHLFDNLKVNDKE
ncbi:hypothetical protein SAMN02745213_00241 [Succinivibrio dextrinosolvens DSM 3072]|uniref:Uncharacterized protein n=1 Tax=Succinivibrio dextrinosolvens DSM 3072 TaxID=1123324 RepID=A0A1T4UXV3_9GAMM|nr:hypothetical protein [Succinivibrio dextrinosolvens]SKA57530.1 hypothetical protein SAMN02745213_00241 [Succinivibrio dextrinosolvens DSM 3072]